MDDGSSDTRVRDIFWHQQAAEDLYRIIRPMEDTNPAKAQKLYQAVQKTAGLLASNPYMGREGRVAGTREAVVPRTPYILPYTITDSYIVVLAVMHGAQRWPSTFEGIDVNPSESSPPRDTRQGATSAAVALLIKNNVVYNQLRGRMLDAVDAQIEGKHLSAALAGAPTEKTEGFAVVPLDGVAKKAVAPALKDIVKEVAA